MSTNMKTHNLDIQGVKEAFKRGRISRNLRTAAILIAASSGALISQPVLAVTACGTFVSLLIAGKIKSNKNKAEISKD